ncbi:protein of unknown function [Tenacibaculum sp. 190130A14a]|uniref:Uncharacterized protein n=1 Tax=Tenacibaculum polynesiense TaxID=3137857 RepID=A0ABP1EZB2_9FLAO
MLRFAYFVNNFYEKTKGCFVLGKYNEKIKVSSSSKKYSLPLNFDIQCGGCLALRV